MAVRSLNPGIAESTLPHIRRIGMADLQDAIARGVDDFRTMPSHVVFLSLIYSVMGLVLGKLAFGYELLPLLFPLVAGFALVGPIAALGLYELSRRREQGLSTSWGDAFGVWRSPSIGGIVTLGILLLLIFGAWMDAAQAIYVLSFGTAEPPSLDGFATQVLTTREGWTLILLGNGAGFLFAVGVLVISVVSFPMLLDRRVSATEAIATSIRAVAVNPGMMVIWGLIVAVSLAIGCLPFFVGLAIVLPVLGHTTWHLYRKMVIS
ncbi:MAG TPA: DUF2189 domain-containing protein [Aliidongia sp.]|nr:DUF2189 domain-containing protein [Aliidongia sp.]